ncbi:MAG: hypothetical protein AAF750_12145 [Planctomycetota bacterium]
MRLRDVVLSVVVAGVVAVWLTMVFTSRDQVGPRRYFNTKNLNAIHNGFNQHALNNKGYYPGLDASGTVVHSTLSEQFAVTLNAGLFEPDTLISPVDTHHEEAVRTGEGYEVTSENHSYAGLSLTEPGGRRDAWSSTGSAEEIVLADRNTGFDSYYAESVWVGEGQGYWRGSVVRNDGSVEFETTHILSTSYAKRESKQSWVWENDNLFEAVGPHDAWLVHD